MGTNLENIKGIYVPTKAIRDKELTYEEVYIYSLVLTLDRENEYKGVGLVREDLSGFLGIPVRRVSIILKKLEQLGYITIIFSEDISNTLKIFSGKAIKP